MERETKYRQLYREIMIVLIIMMIGILIRLPISHFSGIDVTLLNDPDSYYYARKAIEFYNEKVSNWDLSGSRLHDPLMNVVNSNVEVKTPLLLPAFVALICKIFRFLPINGVIFYCCAIISSLSAIPTYLFAKKYSNALGGIVAGFLTATAPSFFYHSNYGYFDTDASILFLTVSFMICAIELVLETRITNQACYFVASLVLLYIFSLTWDMYVFYIAITLWLFMVSLFVMLKTKPLCKKQLVLPVLFAIIVVAFNGKRFFGLFIGTFKQFFYPGKWPPASSFISELKRPALISGGPNALFFLPRIGLINWLGGLPVIVLLAVIIIVLLKWIVKPPKRSPNLNAIQTLVVIVLLVWALTVSPILFMGIRYVQLLTVPLVIFLGIGSGIISMSIEDYVMTDLKLDLVVAFSCILLLESFVFANVAWALLLSLCALLIGLFSKINKLRYAFAVTLISIFLCITVNEYNVSQNAKPIVTKDLSEAINYVKSNTEADSTVVSWWGYGYYYQYALNRQVVSDGGIYDGAYFYWLANVFSTDDSNLSRGISHMLQGGNLDALAIAQSKTDSEIEAVSLLKDILVLERDDAKKYLETKYGFTSAEAEKLVKYSHPDSTRPIYVIVSQDMIENADVIGYFGFWNFNQSIKLEPSRALDNGRYILPKEMSGSVLNRMYLKEDIKGFEELYSNETISVFKISD